MLFEALHSVKCGAMYFGSPFGSRSLHRISNPSHLADVTNRRAIMLDGHFYTRLDVETCDAVSQFFRVFFQEFKELISRFNPIAKVSFVESMLKRIGIDDETLVISFCGEKVFIRRSGH
jgi:hypothetical protein